MRRTLAVATLLTISGGSAYALSGHADPVPYRTTSSAPVVELAPNACPPECDTYPEDAPAPVCHEEDPCWSCSTMGNLQCGPTPVAPSEQSTNEPAPTVAPRSGRAAAPMITTLPDGNLTAIAQGPPAVPSTNPSPGAVGSAPTASGASEGAPVVWEWRSLDASNGYTPMPSPTGCWQANDLRGMPMPLEATTGTNPTNYEIRRRTAAEPVACGDRKQQPASWDPTVPLVTE